MDAADFDYDLPTERIAQQPAAVRDSARLLVDAGPGAPARHASVTDLPDLLRAGDVLVVNDTKVLPARLHLVKPSGGAAEVLLLEAGAVPGVWEALVRPSRRLPPGTVLRARTAGESGTTGEAVVEVGADLGEGRREVRLLGTAETTSGPVVDVEAIAARHGEMPLPPYITERLQDPDRYQTVFARRAGSAAAPTAGLHLTEELLSRVRDRGVDVQAVELVVGLGTFRPIVADRVEDHRMHAEEYHVRAAVMAACEAAHERGGRVVAVGTTTLRALESAAATGELRGRTELFIRRPYPFRVVDSLLTNFHLPRSSLLVLIDAFVGPRWRDLYEQALAGDYRFLSFGDAMLLDRADPTRIAAS